LEALKCAVIIGQYSNANGTLQRGLSLIGPYNSADTVLIQSHLLSMIAAGFDGMIIDWYAGKYEFRDRLMSQQSTTGKLNIA